MPAYMDLNGVPAAGNHWLLDDVLKGQWHFQGFIVSDWDAVKNLTTHGFARDDADAAARAVNAGMDMEMTSHTFRDHLAADVKSGAVSQSTVDEAVRRILTIKYRLGLFDHPYANVSQAAAQMVTPEQRAASRAAGARVAVLLRNQGNVLPLKKAPGTIAVIGPLADSKVDIGGSWSLASHPADNVSVLEGLRGRFASQPNTIRYSKGVEIERPQPSIFDGQFPEPPLTLHTEAEKQAAFQQAIDLVKSSDVTIVVMGELMSMRRRTSLPLHPRPPRPPGSSPRSRRSHRQARRPRPAQRPPVGHQLGRPTRPRHPRSLVSRHRRRQRRRRPALRRRGARRQTPRHLPPLPSARNPCSTPATSP